MKMFLPDVKNSQLHQERFSHIADWWELQQVTGCQMEKQGGYINPWMSGIKGWGEPRDDNPLIVKPYCHCIVLLNFIKLLNLFKRGGRTLNAPLINILLLCRSWEGLCGHYRRRAVLGSMQADGGGACLTLYSELGQTLHEPEPPWSRTQRCQSHCYCFGGE